METIQVYITTLTHPNEVARRISKAIKNHIRKNNPDKRQRRNINRKIRQKTGTEIET